MLFIGACIAMREALHGAVIIPAPSPAAGVVVQQLAFLAVASPFLFLAAVLAYVKKPATLDTELAKLDNVRQTAYR